MNNANNSSKLTAAQTAWLAARKLEARFDERGEIKEIRPVGANTWSAPHAGVQCWGRKYVGGPLSFTVTSFYVCTAFGMPAPAGRVLSEHTTLKAALAALVSL